ncbi:uncharacterized protein LOC132706519 isoform X2 [Cylas formicarius]|uniref:uncharacterized protein LOC132706519 isoform X2 n=1 Tax=Cylas formicarius TaxID=197179 RepID=UPI0029587B3E|nr:uncharacterized protein LOC132706519 isoform X2 [Cylas formicarius]
MPMLCSADGCPSKQVKGISFFRCPKDKSRCENWKRALGFVGNHKYANLTPEQCQARIKICSLHFPEGTYIKHNMKGHLDYDAIPSLNLLKNDDVKDHNDVSIKTENDDELIKNDSIRTEDTTDVANSYEDISHIQYAYVKDEGDPTDIIIKTEKDEEDHADVPIKTEKDCSSYESVLLHSEYMHDDVKKYEDVSTSHFAKDHVSFKNVSLQTEDTPVIVTSYKDVSLQTCVFGNDKSIQTVPALPIVPPKKTKSVQETKSLKRPEAQSSTSLSKKRKTDDETEPEITIKDVHKYLEKNYSESSFKSIKTQLDLLNTSPKGCRYTDEFKKVALSIYFLDPKSYRQFYTLYRLPSKRTLTRFNKKWVISPGFNDFIFCFLELRGKLFKGNEKDCVVCLDEVGVKPHFFYDISRDKIVGFQEGHSSNSAKIATTALVVMVRGLASNWTQPIAYFFYHSNTPPEEMKNILFESVERLTSIGFNVLGVVSDQGSNFRKLVNILKVTTKNNFFFVNDVRLVYLFDVPHLLKSTRNKLFSYNFRTPEGTVKKCYLDTLFEQDAKREYRLCPKLTNQHLSPDSVHKLKVRFASQMLSHSVAAALYAYIDFKVLPPEAAATASFVKTMNDLLDALNSFTGTEKELKFLQRIESVFDNLTVTKVVKRREKYVEKCLNNQMHFIYGWKLTIGSVKALWETLKSKRYAFLPTRNLGQECIENSFGHIKNYGNPMNRTPVQFSRAFKKVFALKHFNGADGAGYVDDINEVLLKTPELLEKCKSVRAELKSKPLKVFTSDYRNISCGDGNTLVCVTEYLLKKSLFQHTCDVCLNYIERCSSQNEAMWFFQACGSNECGSLNAPAVDFIVKLENIFVENFNTLACQNHIGRKLMDLFKNVPFAHPCENFPFEYFVALYIRIRIYFTIKFANRDVKEQRKEKRKNLNLNILQNL